MITKTALIIDNDIRLSNRIKESIEDQLDFMCTVINDLTSTEEYDKLGPFGVYVIRHCDKNTDLINKLTDEDRIVIVLTSKDDDQTRNEILKYSATDYILVTSSSKATVIVNTIQRVVDNSKFNIMIVDDSRVILNTLMILLDTQNLSYTPYSNGEDAWAHLNSKDSAKIDLIISDYEMPNMNGYDLVKRVRTKYHMEDLPILILSGTEDKHMIAKFLKAGANDYIPKPFINEEFLARLSNTLNVLAMFRQIKDMATTDYLTKLHNRSFFYEVGSKVLEVAKRNNNGLSICMIDIDDFKIFNDSYGHKVGDKALQHVAHNLSSTLRESDFCVRFGGEEFVILLTNCSHEKAVEIIENICKTVEHSKLIIDDKIEATITVSAGVTSKIDNLDVMLNKADEYMYKAKANGKNQVYSAE